MAFPLSWSTAITRTKQPLYHYINTLPIKGEQTMKIVRGYQDKQSSSKKGRQGSRWRVKRERSLYNAEAHTIFHYKNPQNKKLQPTKQHIDKVQPLPTEDHSWWHESKSWSQKGRCITCQRSSKSMSSYYITNPTLPFLGRAMCLGCGKERCKPFLGLAIKNFSENPPALPSPIMMARKAHVWDAAATWQKRPMTESASGREWHRQRNCIDPGENKE